MQLLKSAAKIKFPRCIKPATATTGVSDLIVFNDGSVDAMCAVAYERYECRLWAAKTRVNPLRKSTIPRIEMQSASMGTRLSKAINTHADIKFNSVMHILDSKCTMTTLHKGTVALVEFMGNKVTEALETTKPEQWYHTCSKENIADLVTKCNASIEGISELKRVAGKGHLHG